MPRLVWPTLLMVGNLLVACGLGLAFWLSRHGVDVPSYIIGPVAVAVPGLLIALIVEQLTARTAAVSGLVLWTVVATCAVVPGLVYVVDSRVFHGTGVLEPLGAFVLVWAVLLLVLLVLTIFQSVRSGLTSLRLSRKDIRELLMIVIGFVVILLVHSYLYRFIPEADGYLYLLNLREARLDPTTLVGDPRVLFLTFVQLVSSLAGVDPYWVLKLGLPLAHIVLCLTCYCLVRPVINSSWWRVVVALSPLCFPVIIQESLISRPQTLVVLTLVPALYLAAQLGQSTTREQLYWFLLLCLAGLIGLKIHSLFVLLVLVGIVGIGRSLWPYIRRRPIDAAVLLMLVAVLLLPWLRSVSIVSELLTVMTLLWRTIAQGEFRLWFLDSYRNVDGNEVGWPGQSWLLYYGYNLGLLLPALLVLAWTGMRRLRLSFLSYHWPTLITLVVMFVVAEVLPRIGLAFLPDRAWLFLVLASLFFVPLLIEVVTTLPAAVRVSVVVLAMASIAVGGFVTYAKQGWVTQSEFAAVPFVRDQTDQQAIILGQGTSRPAIRYYAERTFLAAPPTLFLSDDEDAVEQYLRDQQAAYEAARARLGVDQQFMRESFERLAARVPGLTTAAQQQVLVEEARAVATLFGQGDYTEARLADHFLLADKQPVYLLYDATKFDSLYGQRAWWRTSNFFGANTDKFSRRYPVVYDQGGVKLWQVR